MHFLPVDDLRDQDIVLQLDKTSEAVPEKNWVPAYYFSICLPDGTKIGSCDLRIGHSSRLYYGGNIGYGIDATYRGRHYAMKACRLLFRLARKHDLDYVLITCDPANTASSRTCELAGGELLETACIPAWHDMYMEGKREVMVYRFDLACPVETRLGIQVKHLDRREWFTDAERQFSCLYLRDSVFRGGIGCLTFTDMHRPMTVDTAEGRLCIADRGIDWLELAPEGGHFVLTAMFREGELFQQYIDMTLQNVVTEDGSAVFQDLILDVVIMGDGSPRVIDRDELEDALRRGWITQEEYALALKTAEDVIGFYRAHGAQIAMKLREYRSMMKSSMREGSAWGF